MITRVRGNFGANHRPKRPELFRLVIDGWRTVLFRLDMRDFVPRRPWQTDLDPLGQHVDHRLRKLSTRGHLVACVIHRFEQDAVAGRFQ